VAFASAPSASSAALLGTCRVGREPGRRLSSQTGYAGPQGCCSEPAPDPLSLTVLTVLTVFSGDERIRRPDANLPALHDLEVRNVFYPNKGIFIRVLKHKSTSTFREGGASSRDPDNDVEIPSIVHRCWQHTGQRDFGMRVPTTEHVRVAGSCREVCLCQQWKLCPCKMDCEALYHNEMARESRPREASSCGLADVAELLVSSHNIFDGRNKNGRVKHGRSTRQD
jgi:hypothetical protein